MDNKTNLLVDRLANIKTIADLKHYISTQQNDECYEDVILFFKDLLDMMGVPYGNNK